MLKLLSYFLVGLMFLFIGVWYGYEKALTNQMYFDAPAKITLYNAVLEKESCKEFLRGSIIRELRILKQLENKTTPYLLNHPVHKEVKNAYEKLYPDIDNLPYVIKAKKFIKTHNKVD